jgi:hypothetical protein
VKISFCCPVCDYSDRVTLPAAAAWQCPHCDHLLSLPAEVDPSLPACAVCGNPELYKKKDFPHGLGMTIFVLACVLSVFYYARHEFWVTWAILISSALFDGLLYLWVKDVIVCYRCDAHHRGIVPGPEHKPFELTIGERYRQERIRKEALKDNRL